MNHVIQSTLEIYQELLGLKFAELKDTQTWHEEVRTFEVKDEQSGDRLGHFYLDLHPRPNKYNHAAVFPLIKRSNLGGKLILPAAAMVVNFDKGTEN